MELFSGWIAGMGTGSGHRLVVGHWHASPYGQVTDAMVEDPAGRRSLYAPTPQLAEFLGEVYRFDEVQVGHCSARRAGRRRWEVQAGPLQLSFTVGRRSLLGWLLWAIPAPLARAPWWVSLQDQVARRLLPGVRTRGGTRDGRVSGTAPATCTRSSPPAPPSTAVISAPWARSGRRSASDSARCPTGHPLST